MTKITTYYAGTIVREAVESGIIDQDDLQQVIASLGGEADTGQILGELHGAGFIDDEAMLRLAGEDVLRESIDFERFSIDLDGPHLIITEEDL